MFLVNGIITQQALECLSRSLDLSPQTATYKDLGRLHLKKGDIRQAIETYKRASKYAWYPVLMVTVYHLIICLDIIPTIQRYKPHLVYSIYKYCNYSDISPELYYYNYGFNNRLINLKKLFSI